MRRKQSFKNSYSELYLITPEIYHKIMNNLDNNVDRDSTVELNQGNDNLNPSISNTQSSLSDSSTSHRQSMNSSDHSTDNQSKALLSTTSNLPRKSNLNTSNDILNRISELRKIVEDNVFKNSVSKVDYSTQTDPTSNKSNTEMNKNLQSDREIQTDAPSANDTFTQTNFENLKTDKGVSTNVISSNDVGSQTNFEDTIKNDGTNVKKVKEIFFCQFCKPAKIFSTKYNRKRHIVNIHSTKKPSNDVVVRFNNNISSKRIYDDNDEGTDKLQREMGKKNIVRKRKSEGEFGDINTLMKKEKNDIAGKRKNVFKTENHVTKKQRTDPFAGKRKRTSHHGGPNKFARWT